jgi:hypothetical protein
VSLLGPKGVTTEDGLELVPLLSVCKMLLKCEYHREKGTTHRGRFPLELVCDDGPSTKWIGS